MNCTCAHAVSTIYYDKKKKKKNRWRAKQNDVRLICRFFCFLLFLFLPIARVNRRAYTVNVRRIARNLRGYVFCLFFFYVFYSFYGYNFLLFFFYRRRLKKINHFRTVCRSTVKMTLWCTADLKNLLTQKCVIYITSDVLYGNDHDDDGAATVILLYGFYDCSGFFLFFWKILMKARTVRDTKAFPLH